MALQVNNDIKLKSCNVNGFKCKKIFLDNKQIWSSAVTLVNNVGSEFKFCFNDYDTAGGAKSHTVLTINNVIPGHRYFIRCGNTRHGEETYYSRFVVDDGGITTILTEAYGPLNSPLKQNVIYVAKSNTLKFVYQGDGRAAQIGYSVITQGYLFMVVDITEIEELAGTQYDGSTFWNQIGNVEFYNSKEFEV